jgi:hypothetical protein
MDVKKRSSFDAWYGESPETKKKRSRPANLQLERLTRIYNFQTIVAPGVIRYGEADQIL